MIPFQEKTSSVLLSTLDSIIIEKSQGPQPSTVKANTQQFSSQNTKFCQLPSMYLSLSTNNCPSDFTNSCASEAKKVKLACTLLYLDKAVAALREIPSSSHRKAGVDAFALSIAKDAKPFFRGRIRTSGRNSKSCSAK
jgi:hypothetical protein